MIVGNSVLRRHRKSLLSDLSSLVKTGKAMEEHRNNTFNMESEAIANEVIDEMLLKAFKIVTRGVKFLDAFNKDPRAKHGADRRIELLEEPRAGPSTPPADRTSFKPGQECSNAFSRRLSARSHTSIRSSSQTPTVDQTRRLSYRRTSATIYSPSLQGSNARRSGMQPKAAGLSSETAQAIIEVDRTNFVSSRLKSAHRSLTSSLASLIGRLTMTSTSQEIFIDLRQVVAAGKALCTVVESLCAQGMQTESNLTGAREMMYASIRQHIEAARHRVRANMSDEDSVMATSDCDYINRIATDFIVASGECVSEAKAAINMIGDFEIEPAGPGIDAFPFGTTANYEQGPVDDVPERMDETPIAPQVPAPMPPIENAAEEKPLPSLPMASGQALDAGVTMIQAHAANLAIDDGPAPPSEAEEPVAGHVRAPSRNYVTDFGMSFNMSFSEPSPSSERIVTPSGRVESQSSTMSKSTYLSRLRDSESSTVSQTSTRATTPDPLPYQNHSSQNSTSTNSSFGSQRTIENDIEDAEIRVLEKTYANELILGDKGQVLGGSLPALVERLTIQNSTPDPTFVSTFYLTFRLFTTPTEFAQTLIDRFDYVSESSHIALPVRLRVYNVFKGWLETHWRKTTDDESLPVIRAFAIEKLSVTIPQAGKRLLELTDKVSHMDRPLVPRLVSSMGKTNTATSNYIPADYPPPPCALSRSSISALQKWMVGGKMPTILDIEPLCVARQLTLKEMEIFLSVMSYDLVAFAVDKKRAHKAKVMCDLNNDICKLAVDTILEEDTDIKKRAQVVKHWIKVAAECLKLNNYSALFAITGALTNTTIERLTKTWEMVPPKWKALVPQFVEILTPHNNFKGLRERLQVHVPPCLPFLGLYQGQLAFAYDGNPARRKLPGGDVEVINFDKHTIIAQIIGEVQKFQIPYRLHEVPELQTWLQHQIVRVRFIDEGVHQEKSRRIKPKGCGSAENLVMTDSTGSIRGVEGERAISSTMKDMFNWRHGKGDGERLTTTGSHSS